MERLTARRCPIRILTQSKKARRAATRSTELEGIIAELWQDALGVDVVGLQVNFFDLGANSLSVAEVATSLRQRLKRDIPLTDFFAYPTIAALAAHLSGMRTAGMEIRRTNEIEVRHGDRHCLGVRGRHPTLSRTKPNEGT